MKQTAFFFIRMKLNRVILTYKRKIKQAYFQHTHIHTHTNETPGSDYNMLYIRNTYIYIYIY